ncbi:MAG: Phosphoribosylglycinamide formyltransferase 2 [bacterium]|nr:Phosphoribosylglycinamide formyltransferase 2 [bacterium]
MATVLVLGASRWQIPLMEAAHRLGLQVAATDRDPDAPGRHVADFFAPIDLIDIAGTIEVARSHQIAAVATDQTDLAVPTQAAVAEALGLRGPSPQVAHHVTHKGRMRELTSAAGILNPAWVLMNEPMHLPVRWIDLAHAAVVVKPADSMGSRGVRVVEQADTIDDALIAAMGYSRSGEALLEEYLVGTEVTVEGFWDCTGPRILAISEKQHSPKPHRTALHLTFPPQMPDSTLAAIRDAAERTARALGITGGPLHGEFMVTERGIYLIEFANRGGGSGTSSHIVPAASGVDMLELTWRQLLGERVVAEPTHQRAVLLRFLCYPPGRITAIRGLAEAQGLPGVVFCDLYREPGTQLGAVTNDTERHGCVIVDGATVAEAHARLREVLRVLEVEIDGVVIQDLYRQTYPEPVIVAA